jgi:HK97 family phage major capsid protein
MNMHFKEDSGGSGDVAEFKAVMDALKARDAEIKAFATKADTEIREHGKVLGDTKAVLDKLLADANGLSARLLELEQKLARRPGGEGGGSNKSIGQQFTESDQFKALQTAGERGRARMEVKATITSAITGAGGVGDAIRPDRLAGIVTPPERPMTVRDLIAPGRTSSNAVEYVVETGFTNSAAMVAEGALKPSSDLSFDLKTVNVRTLAHIFKVSRQALSDVPALQSYIDNRARYGIMYAEEAQLLLGDGTGQNLLGLIPQATAFDMGLTVGADTRIDVIRKAILQVRIAEYRASGIVMTPQDWAAIELTKDTTARYIWANPTINNGQNLWGIPVIDTNAMPSAHFMVGAFNIAAQVFDREQAAVEVATENEDDFVKNLCTIRAEERLALAVFRPQSFVYGSFSGFTT